MRRALLLIFVLCVVSLNKLSAQEWGVKTNLLYDATTSINLGIEKAVADKWTIALSGNWNPFQFEDNKKWHSPKFDTGLAVNLVVISSPHTYSAVFTT